MTPFADRLANVVRRKGPLCVGIDPRWDMLPAPVRARWCEYAPADCVAFA